MMNAIWHRLVAGICFGLFSFVLFAQGSWEVVPSPTTQHLRSVFFTDSLYGWAVGDTGTIIHTTDGGDSWQVQDAGTANNIVNVFFLNRQEGWASSWNFEGFFGTLILKTTDGGNTWTHHPYPDENIFMNCILYLDSLRGWMGGSPHAIVHTTDGGQNWTQAAIDTNALAFFPVLNIYFYDDQYAYACGGMFDIAGVAWSSSDGGNSWQPISTLQAPADEIHGLHLFDSLNVLGAGGDPDLGYGVGMLRTNDGGANWDYEELSMAGNAFDIDFRNEYEAWAPLGPAQQMVYSLDAGENWTLVNSPENVAVFDMIFTDTLHGYGVGYNGAVIRYIPKAVAIAEYDSKHGISFMVSPNPAQEWVNFMIRAPQADASATQQAVVILYDMHGRAVKRIEISGWSGGQGSFKANLSHFVAGIYNCTLLINDGQRVFVDSQKLILR